MHAPLQEITGGHDGPRGGESHQSSSEFGLYTEHHVPTRPTCRSSDGQRQLTVYGV